MGPALRCAGGPVPGGVWKTSGDRPAVSTLAHGSLPRLTEALRVPARLNRVAPLPELGPPCVSAYAQVVRGGRVAQGAVVEVG